MSQPDFKRSTTKESVMKNVIFAIFVIPFLVMPAFAGTSNAGGKPMVVAENLEHGAGSVGDRHRHRDEAHVRHHRHHDDRR